MSQTIQPTAGPASRPPRRRTWRTLLAVILVIAVAIGVGFLLSKCAAGSQAANPFGRGGRPTVTVGIAQATLGDVPITVTALGTVTPEATVSVTSRVTGQLQQVRFTEGQMVRRGDLLAQVDPAPFQAALTQAQGSLARDAASLANAKLDLQRYNTLLGQNSVAGQTRDTQAALVKQDEGLVASDKGAVDTARLNLQWSRIVSPVAGRVGIRQIDAGNQISANSSTPIAVVTQIDPIDVIFAVPEDAIPSIVRHTNFGAGLPVTAYDRTGGAPIGAGSLATIDNVVDTTTGTVKGKARFGNPNAALFPNQFVNITVLVDTLKNQVIVPTTAVRHGPNGDFVWVLQADNTVKSAPVTTGPGTGETTSIVSGLTAGQTVVTDGGDRLRDGASVTLPRGAAPGAGGAGGHAHHGGKGGGKGASPGAASQSGAGAAGFGGVGA
ncbi:MAG TPA: MdtA/MuxA family multidrug efflux RND transporter periplasmic adaptor subunit [Caulobacteraceae bacterium]|nr:MdtA/MuxA family multidrug efflux RND transporter periplasmic adaptor subunit [Caulobacteraceae bacterium]